MIRSGGIDSTPEPLLIVARAIAAVMAFLALSAIYVAVRFDPSHGRRRCGACWYDMSASEGRLCPECGFHAETEKGMFRTRRAPRLAFFAVLCLAGAYAMFLLPKVHSNGWQAAAPTTALIIGAPWWPDQFIDGPEYSLCGRVRNQELREWQESLLRWRVDRLIAHSENLETLARAGAISGAMYEEGMPRARMSPAAQIAFFTAFGVDAARGSLRRTLVYSMNLLPDPAAPEAAPAALAAITSAMGSPTPIIVHWGMSMAPLLGREGVPLVPSLIAVAENRCWSRRRGPQRLWRCRAWGSGAPRRRPSI